MKNSPENLDSIGYIFDRVFDSLDKVVERMDRTDELTDKIIKEIKDELRHAKDESRKALDYIDVLTTLGQSLSSEGLKALINDVHELKTFMVATMATSAAERSIQDKVDKKDNTRLDLYWKIALWIAGIIIAALAFLLKTSMGA